MRNQAFRFPRLALYVATIAMLFLGCVDRANATPDAVRFEAVGWAFAPAVSNGEIKGFLAWVVDAEAVGNNISIVWFKRESSTHWSTWAWQQDDIGVAAYNIRTTLNDGNVFASDSLVDPLADVVTPLQNAAPQQLVQGLFLADPFQTIVNGSPQPSTLLEELSNAGWRAAPSLSSLSMEEAMPCGVTTVAVVDVLLTDLARAAETAIFSQSTTVAPCAISWPCSCSFTYGTPTCGGWTLTHSISTGGGATTCWYERTCTRTWSSTGKEWYCTNCAGSGTETYTDLGSITVFPGDPCPPSPD